MSEIQADNQYIDVDARVSTCIYLSHLETSPGNIGSRVGKGASYDRWTPRSLGR